MVRNSIQISGVYSLSEAAILQVHRSDRSVSDWAHKNNMNLLPRTSIY
jgi:hypothetical protein